MDVCSKAGVKHTFARETIFYLVLLDLTGEISDLKQSILNPSISFILVYHFSADLSFTYKF